MCTAPQNIYVPRDGIKTADGHLSFDEVAAGLAQAVEKLVSDPARAVEITGAIQNPGVVRRIDAARAFGLPVLCDRRAIGHRLEERRVGKEVDITGNTSGWPET